MMPQHCGSIREPLTCLHVDYDAIWLVFAVARELRAQSPCFPGMTRTPSRDERRWNMWYHGRNAREVNGRYRHLSYQPYRCQKAEKCDGRRCCKAARCGIATPRTRGEVLEPWRHGLRIRRGMKIHCLGRTARRHTLIYT